MSDIPGWPTAAAVGLVAAVTAALAENTRKTFRCKHQTPEIDDLVILN